MKNPKNDSHCKPAGRARAAIQLSCALLLGIGLNLPAFAQAQEKIFRLGIIGLDTTHVIAFTSHINNLKNNTGCKVVAAFPGGSPDFKASADRIGKFTADLRDKHGVEMVASIEELCQKVDGVLLESVDGRPHLAQARPVIAAGKPLFVDKPVAASLEDVVEIFRLAKEKNVPIWSSSALRYGKGVAGAQTDEALGKVVGCDVFGSSSWAEHHPDLYLYGIHPVEGLFTVMGPGCEQVRRIKAGGTDLVIGVWKDGRIGTFRDLRTGKPAAPVVIFGTKGSSTGQSSGSTGLIEGVVRFFKTGTPPVSAEETIEIYAFMSAADASKAKDGAAVSISDLIAQAKRKR
ncbi:MAG: Gfo/Idh/MocA family oxidoreductase [Verrucomicrobia bacterium]|nr:Gfo/Idh/MocA family oxidoreductase [Verrucomicrobiota bacterium]